MSKQYLINEDKLYRFYSFAVSKISYEDLDSGKYDSLIDPIYKSLQNPIDLDEHKIVPIEATADMFEKICDCVGDGDHEGIWIEALKAVPAYPALKGGGHE